MSEDIESCGKGLHEWKTDGEEACCIHCHTFALDWSIEDDGEGWYDIIVNTHEHTLHDELKAVQEATICALCGKEYNKGSINNQKYCNCYNATQVLVVEIIDEDNGTVYQEYEE